MALIAEEGFDPEFGARPCGAPSSAGWITCSRMVLEGSLERGDRLVVGAKEGKLGFEITHGATGESKCSFCVLALVRCTDKVDPRAWFVHQNEPMPPVYRISITSSAYQPLN